MGKLWTLVEEEDDKQIEEVKVEGEVFIQISEEKVMMEVRIMISLKFNVFIVNDLVIINVSLM